MLPPVHVCQAAPQAITQTSNQNHALRVPAVATNAETNPQSAHPVSQPHQTPNTTTYPRTSASANAHQ